MGRETDVRKELSLQVHSASYGSGGMPIVWSGFAIHVLSEWAFGIPGLYEDVAVHGSSISIDYLTTGEANGDHEKITAY